MRKRAPAGWDAKLADRWVLYKNILVGIYAGMIGIGCVIVYEANQRHEALMSVRVVCVAVIALAFILVPLVAIDLHRENQRVSRAIPVLGVVCLLGLIPPAGLTGLIIEHPPPKTWEVLVGGVTTETTQAGFKEMERVLEEGVLTPEEIVSLRKSGAEDPAAVELLINEKVARLVDTIIPLETPLPPSEEDRKLFMIYLGILFALGLISLIAHPLCRGRDRVTDCAEARDRAWAAAAPE